MYKNATAHLIPLSNSIQDTARFPNKISEYLASAKPIITTDVGEIKHYFKDMDNFDEILDSLIEDIYLTYDTNRDGFLQRDETESFIQGCLKSMDQRYKPQVFQNFFEKYDTNQDGKISREEMAVFVKGVVFTSVDESDI